MWIKSGCLGKGLCVSVGTSISVFLNKNNLLSYFKPQTVCFSLIKTRKTNKVPQHAAESKFTRTSWVHISRWAWTPSPLLQNVNLRRKKRRPHGKSQIQARESDTVTQHVETRNKKGLQQVLPAPWGETIVRASTRASEAASGGRKKIFLLSHPPSLKKKKS